MKRLDRDGFITTVPRPKDECYLYMPNPAMIHTESAKIRHFLAIVDFYIHLGKPKIYEVEPQIDPEYIPDAYTKLEQEGPVVVEVQRSHTSLKQMQKKVDGFVRTYKLGKHDARTLWVVADEDWRVFLPDGFTLKKTRLQEVR